MDTRSKAQRSFIMKSVRSRNTGPELVVRRTLHALGYRYGLHRKDLPGRPDIVMPKHKAVVFVHGCFWHGHGCPKGRLPKSRLDFWVPKIDRNRQRDRESVRLLRKSGWRVLTIWQCQTKDVESLSRKLAKFLTLRNRKNSRGSHQ
ncbi:very short patch repair endonuclease [Undibacter mobilis]|uniref:Very short patch repair endonuclease n=1 Tax=Undibacter mobilis TaxID=2292256 RepID=A0A371B4E8_9BRAD|nr:DNA mismatch endonuclease Vsr [Undibacter mobilis]RDV02414.1 DNA mismatch endonuclease Vsr [Undibacter mobilis]